MTRARENAEAGDGIRQSAQRLSEGMATLLRDHLKLFRIELRQDLRQIGKDAGLMALALPLLLAAFLFANLGIAALLARVLPMSAALFIVAAANGFAGGILWVLGMGNARKAAPAFPESAAELQRSRELMQALAQRRSMAPPAGPKTLPASGERAPLR